MCFTCTLHLSRDRSHTLCVATHRDGCYLAVRVRDQELWRLWDSRYVPSVSRLRSGVEGIIHYVLTLKRSTVVLNVLGTLETGESSKPVRFSGSHASSQL